MSKKLYANNMEIALAENVTKQVNNQKAYTDSVATDTLNSAKSYTDNKTSQVANSAKTYTDSSVGGMSTRLQTQFTSMYIPEAKDVGKIVQYVGATNNGYIQGYFYICTATTQEVSGENVTTYSWEEIAVSDIPDADVFDATEIFDFRGKRGIYTNKGTNSTQFRFYNKKTNGDTISTITNFQPLLINVYADPTRLPTSLQDVYFASVIGISTNSNTSSNGALFFCPIYITGVNDITYTTTAINYYRTLSTYDQQISGVKTFTSLPESSVVPTTNNQLVNKKYVDDSISNAITDALGGSY